MHELAICQALLRQAGAVADQRDARILRLIVSIGPLSGVEEGLLRRAFSLASAGSAAEGAQLEIRAAPVEVSCDRCGSSFPVPANRLVCPGCGDWKTRVVSGDGLVLERIEMQTSTGGTPVSS